MTRAEDKQKTNQGGVRKSFTIAFRDVPVRFEHDESHVDDVSDVVRSEVGIAMDCSHK
jgi:hypothetical protein